MTYNLCKWFTSWFQEPHPEPGLGVQGVKKPLTRKELKDYSAREITEFLVNEAESPSMVIECIIKELEEQGNQREAIDKLRNLLL